MDRKPTVHLGRVRGTISVAEVTPVRVKTEPKVEEEDDYTTNLTLKAELDEILEREGLHSVAEPEQHARREGLIKQEKHISSSVDIARENSITNFSRSARVPTEILDRSSENSGRKHTLEVNSREKASDDTFQAGSESPQDLNATRQESTETRDKQAQISTRRQKRKLLRAGNKERLPPTTSLATALPNRQSEASSQQRRIAATTVISQANSNHQGSRSSDNQSTSPSAQPDLHSEASERRTRRHICKFCLEIFPSSCLLRRHVRTHVGEKDFRCPVCSRSFKTWETLQGHLKVHTGDSVQGRSRHPCKECGKTFRTPFELKRHDSVHTGLKPFTCDVCNKTFTQAAHLTSHMTIHTGENLTKARNACSVCKKTFVKPSDLTAHLRIHTGEKPFACPTCKRRFAQASQVKAHQKRNGHNQKE